MEKEKKQGKLWSLHMGGANGISRQHPQILTTHLLQEHWEPCDETWNSGKTDDVHGKLGHQDGPSMRRNRSMWPIFQMATMHADGWLQPFCVRCRGCLARPHLSAWRVVSVSTSAYSKEAWKLHVCGRKWRVCGGRMDEEKKWSSFGYVEGKGEQKICSFMWADNFWIIFHSKEHLEQS